MIGVMFKAELGPKVKNKKKMCFISFLYIKYFTQRECTFCILTDCVIHLQRIQALDAVTDGVHLYGVFLAGRHIRHFGFRVAHAGKFDPSRIVFRAISDGVFGEYRVRRCFPVHDDGVARDFFDTEISRWTRYYKKG